MLTTSNYALKKPEGTDIVNINDFNFNADTIDKTLKGLSDGKANTNHGNHVPTLESANNARFLRNDDTWQTVTPANIGAVPNSTLGSTIIQADSDSSSTSECVSLKAGGNELKITSSGGGSTPAKSNTSATLNGNVLYHAGNKPNKSDVGLSNVDNTSDLNKPISIATQTALNGKASTSHNHTIANVTNLQPSLDAINSNIAQLSNSNLLINGDFRVWQRGTPITSAYGQITCDRWISTATSITATKKDYGINIVKVQTDGSPVINFRQRIEASELKKFIGKNLTFSAMVKGNATICVYDRKNTTVLYGNATTYTNTSGAFKLLTLNIPKFTYNSNVDYIEFSIIDGSGTLDVQYAKLEVGNVATPNSPRPYSEELAMCQRYYLGDAIGIITDIWSNSLNYFISTPTELRVIPTVKDVAIWINAGGQLTGFTFNGASKNRNGCSITATKSNHGVTTDSHITLTGLDAEIY